LLRQAWRSAGIALGYGLSPKRYLGKAHTNRSLQDYRASVIFRNVVVMPTSI
jgi:hypothetical protein